MLVHRWIVLSDKGTDIDISVDLFVFCMHVSFSVVVQVFSVIVLSGD